MLYSGLRSCKESEVRFLTTLGVRAGFLSDSDSDVQLDHFLHHTPKLGIPVEMLQFLLKFLLKQISCCAPWFPLILTAKFHSLYVKESESEILERSGQSWSQIFYLRFHNPGFTHSSDRLLEFLLCSVWASCNPAQRLSGRIASLSKVSFSILSENQAHEHWSQKPFQLK